MKFLRHALVLAICLGAGPTAFAQSDRCFRVVASSGLNLRDKPSLQGKKVLTVPFGECLTVEDAVNPDTLDGTVVEGIEGGWVKVDYEGTTGYAFNGFFGEGEFEESTALPWIFLYEEGDCNVPLYRKTDYPHRYGVYFRDDGRMEIVPVQLRYHFEKGAFDYRWLVVGTDRSEEAVFLIGSKQPLIPGEITGYALDPEETRLYPNDKTAYAFAPYGIRVTCKVKPSESDFMDGKEFASVTFHWNGKTQVLYPMDGKVPEELAHHAFYLSVEPLWTGDLDRDGRADLVIRTGYYESGRVEVWLSSLAKPGALVGLAAQYFWGLCC